jgi:hypothetical protein
VSTTPQSREHLAAFDLLYGGFLRAAEAAGATIERFYRIGDDAVCLRFAGPGLLPYLTPALAHVAIEPTSPALTVCMWDSVSTGAPLAPFLRWMCGEMRKAPFHHLSPRQEIRLLSSALAPATFEMGAGVLSVLDTGASVGTYWVEDGARLPYHEQGAPLRTLFGWWLTPRGIQCVHAAAVGTETGGVLLAGKGGSGKSTAALACLDSDLRYVSDDYCLVRSEPKPYVHTLYNTAKLGGLRDLQRQPRFLPMIHNPDGLGQEKVMMFLERHLPEKLCRGFPLVAILLPRVAGEGRTRLTRVSPGAALRAIAPTTMFQLPGAAAASFDLMAGLARRLPAYRLDLGPDLTEIPTVLLRFLEEGAEAA